MPKLTPTFKDNPTVITPKEEKVPLTVINGRDEETKEDPNKIEIPPVSDLIKPVAPKKVAILGTAPSSRMLAPFNDPEWQIWSCSPGNMGCIPRFDRWF